MSFDSRDNAVSVYELNRYVKTLMDNDVVMTVNKIKNPEYEMSEDNETDTAVGETYEQGKLTDI